MNPAPLGLESRWTYACQARFAISQRRSSKPIAPLTSAKTLPAPLGSISGTGADCVVPNEIAGECKFWLDPVSLGRNRGVPPPVVREMERLVFEHVDLLLEKYDEHHPPGNRSRSDESVD